MSTDTIIDQEKFQTKGVTTVSIAHAVHDTYSGTLPALLPVLIEKFSMSNTAAGMLSVFMQAPSLLQPLIGHLADRKNLRLLIVLAPTITAAAMSLLTIAPTYGFLIFLLILAGISSAALHAIGPVLGSNYSGNKLGRGMSFWMVGGELGRALGPLMTVTALGYLTLEQFPWLMMGGVLISAYLFTLLSSVTTKTTVKEKSVVQRDGLKNIWRVMLPISILHFTRALTLAALTIFLPIYLTNQGTNLWVAGASLTILQVSGMVGAFLAGPLSDRFGRRRLILISYLATPIFMLLFLQMKSLWQLPVLILLGFFVISVVPVIMAIVMENFSENRSFANGVYMAVSFIIQAIATLLVGVLSDAVNMQFTFYLSAGLIFLGLPVIIWLPKSRKSITK